MPETDCINADSRCALMLGKGYNDILGSEAQYSIFNFNQEEGLQPGSTHINIQIRKEELQKESTTSSLFKAGGKAEANFLKTLSSISRAKTEENHAKKIQNCYTLIVEKIEKIPFERKKYSISHECESFFGITKLFNILDSNKKTYAKLQDQIKENQQKIVEENSKPTFGPLAGIFAVSQNNDLSQKKQELTEDAEKYRQKIKALEEEIAEKSTLTEDILRRFYDRYGTHYISEIEVPRKLALSFTLEETEEQNNRQTDVETILESNIPPAQINARIEALLRKSFGKKIIHNVGNMSFSQTGFKENAYLTCLKESDLEENQDTFAALAKLATRLTSEPSYCDYMKCEPYPVKIEHYRSPLDDLKIKNTDFYYGRIQTIRELLTPLNQELGTVNQLLKKTTECYNIFTVHKPLNTESAFNQMLIDSKTLLEKTSAFFHSIQSQMEGFPIEKELAALKKNFSSAKKIWDQLKSIFDLEDYHKRFHFLTIDAKLKRNSKLFSNNTKLKSKDFLLDLESLQQGIQSFYFSLRRKKDTTTLDVGNQPLETLIKEIQKTLDTESGEHQIEESQIDNPLNTTTKDFLNYMLQWIATCAPIKGAVKDELNWDAHSADLTLGLAYLTDGETYKSNLKIGLTQLNAEYNVTDLQTWIGKKSPKQSTQTPSRSVFLFRKTQKPSDQNISLPQDFEVRIFAQTHKGLRVGNAYEETPSSITNSSHNSSNHSFK